jgi:hypothetical protein
MPSSHLIGSASVMASAASAGTARETESKQRILEINDTNGAERVMRMLVILLTSILSLKLFLRKLVGLLLPGKAYQIAALPLVANVSIELRFQSAESSVEDREAGSRCLAVPAAPQLQS